MKLIRKKHRVKHRSDHRDPKKKLKRVLKLGFINFTIPGLLILAISLTHQILLAHFNLWILRGCTVIILLWFCIGFFILAGGILLWLRVKAG